jgi:hypothetical protein
MPGSARAAVQCFFRPSRAEVAGLSAGTTESKGPEYMPVGQAVAELCRMADADESLIPQWTEEGRRRAEAAQHPPFRAAYAPYITRPRCADHDFASDPSCCAGVGHNAVTGGSERDMSSA